MEKNQRNFHEKKQNNRGRKNERPVVSVDEDPQAVREPATIVPAKRTARILFLFFITNFLLQFLLYVLTSHKGKTFVDLTCHSIICNVNWGMH